MILESMKMEIPVLSPKAGVIKDAGDDPDVTHGALILATVRLAAPGAGVTFKAGEGVGTLPCAHVFHADCVRPWLRRELRCPLCTRRLDGDEAGGSGDGLLDAEDNELRW